MPATQLHENYFSYIFDCLKSYSHKLPIFWGAYFLNLKKNLTFR
jgi:hypothetical protein